LKILSSNIAITRPFLVLMVLVFIMSLISCEKNSSVQSNSQKVASVFKYDLYYDDVPQDLRNAKSKDSSALVNGFVDQWIRKMLLLHEAELRKPESLDIDKLVEDYKQSLLINNLEKQVITEELDTIVPDKELESMYEMIKANFVQEFPIIRLSYIKIPEKAPQIDKFYEWWKKDERGKIKYYSDKYAEFGITDYEVWKEWNDVQKYIDENILKKYSFKKTKKIQKNIGEFEYFIEIKEFVDKNEISPLSYIEDQIKSIIIQKRKTTVIDVYLERLYLKEFKKKNIVINKQKES